MYLCIYIYIFYNPINCRSLKKHKDLTVFSPPSNCAFSESDITQESPFTSADTGNSRSAFPSYTGTRISTEGSLDFWRYGVSFMLLDRWSAGEAILRVRICQFVSIFHSFTLTLFLYILILKFTTLYNSCKEASV